MISTGELKDGKRISQTIRVSREHFSGIAVVVATFGRTNTHRLRLRLRTLQGDAIAERVIEAGALLDNRELEFYFEPRSPDEGAEYVFTIEAQGAAAGNAVSFWLDRNDPDSDEFPECEVDGVVRRARRIQMRTLYSPPLAGEGPSAILYSPVTQCNLNCVHCISRDTRKTLQFMPEETKKEIAALAKAGVLTNISADYSGDIFFIDQKYGGELDYLYGLQADLYLDSHGNHMSEEIGRRLLNSNVKRINFSLDAASAETHAGIRRGSRPFAEVVANLRFFMDLRKTLGKTDFAVTLSMTLMKRNLHEVPALVDLACELGVQAVIVRHIEVYTDDMDGESLVHDPDLFNRHHGPYLEYAKEKGMVLGLPPPFPITASKPGHRHCRVAWESMSVLGNGDVMACCIPGTVIGNVKGSSISEIWKGPLYQEFRKRVNSEDPPAVCQNCPIFRQEGHRESYLFNRVRKSLPSLRDDLQASIARRTAVPAAS